VDGDFSEVPMTDDVTFQNPYMSEPISGADTVQQYEIDNFSSTIAGIQDGTEDGVTYLLDGDNGVAIFVLEMNKGWLVPTADYFEFEDGKISSITPYFDTAIFTTDPPVAE
jgi:ketosteroid isomerase-like protein